MHIFRLQPGMDLKLKLEEFARANDSNGSVIVTCVGSLKQASLRLAKGTQSVNFEGPFEILSLVGTLCKDGVHLHISLGDQEGRVVGGHLMAGCLIYTTAEIAVLDTKDLRLTRSLDSKTGYKELVVLPKE